MVRIEENVIAAVPGAGVEGSIARTLNPSFPRSGNHLLQRLLRRCYGDEALRVCNTHREPEKRLAVCAATNFQKTHDLGLEEEVVVGRKHLVQVRYPLESIASWYTMSIGGTPADTPAHWQAYAMNMASFWLRFYRKWVLEPVPDRLVVDYAALVAEPRGTLRSVCDFLGGPVVSDAVIDEACAEADIRRRHELRGFRHASESCFGLIEGYFCTTPGVDVGSRRLVLGDVDQLR